jgi:hypothetical protein
MGLVHSDMKPFELECEVTETTAQRDLFLTVRRVLLQVV